MESESKIPAKKDTIERASQEDDKFVDNGTHFSSVHIAQVRECGKNLFKAPD